MAREHDIEASEELSREAEALLAEYFRIRREYNALDKHNPSHSDRRAALKGRYHELDRKYSTLVREQDRVVEDAQGPKASRADVLWRGAVEGYGPHQPAADRDAPAPPDGPWIELNTPVEGEATDALFDEALKQAAPDLPEESPRATAGFEGESTGGDEPEPDEPIDEVAADTEALADAGPAGDAADALRELTEHLQSGELDGLADQEDALPPPPSESPAAPSQTAKRRASPVAEIYTAQTKTTKRPPAEPAATPDARPIACPSCGEMLKAGTQVCSYCGARLIAADTAEGEADAVPPHLQLRTADRVEKSNLGAKALITFGWLLVLAAATWLIVRNAGLWTDEIDAWLSANDLEIVQDNPGGGILGIALALLGGTLVGLGVFVGRFIRVVVSMHELARSGRVETIEKLIMRGDEIDVRDARGCTPLHFAIVAKQREVVAVLVGNGADINAHNDRGDTPLHMAAANRDHALVQYLLNKGADVDAVNDGGSTLMHVAALVGDVGLLKLFLEKELPIDATTKVGFTPLHFAAQSGHDDAIEFLLERGADPNAASEHGTTPIFPATRNGHLRAVRLLIDGGADYNTRRGHDFESPLGIARIHKRREIYDYLESIGAAD